MALVALGGLVPIPAVFDVGVSGTSSPGFITQILDAADEYVGMVVQAPKAGTIKKVHFVTGTVTTGATLDVTIEGVSGANGSPDGTPLTNGSTTVVIADADDNVAKEAVFSTGPTVTKNQLIAVKIKNPTVSPGNLQINASGNAAMRGVLRPYTFTALPTFSRSSDRMPVFGLEYNDGSFAHIPLTNPVLTAADSNTINTGTTPDEIGLKFKFPMPVKIQGFWAMVLLATGTVPEFVLYDSDGTTVLESLAIDPDQSAITGINADITSIFDSEVTLAKDTFCRLVLKPDSATNQTLRSFSVISAAAMDAHEGGQNFHLTQRTDAGAWTDTTTKRPYMGLLVSAFDDGSGRGAVYCRRR